MTTKEYLEQRRAGLNERIEKFKELQKTPGKEAAAWRQMTVVLIYTNETLRGLLVRLHNSGVAAVQAAKSFEKTLVIPSKHSIH